MSGERLMLNVTGVKVVCEKDGASFDCTEYKSKGELPSNVFPVYCEIHAQLFDCSQ